MPVGEKQTFRFGPFQLDTQCGQLRKNGVGLKLQGQPIQVLEILLEKPGQLVTREEIRQRLWTSDTFVDFDHSLNTAVKKLRQTLGDEADTPRYIETLPKRGYRFISEVAREGEKEEPKTDARETAAVAVLPNGPLEPRLEEVKEEPDSGEPGSATGGAAVSDRRTAMRTSPQQGRWLFALAGVAALVLAVGVLWVFFRTPPVPKVLGIHQISHTGRPKGNPVVLTDGVRVYFTDLVEGRRIPMVVSALGGDAVPIPMPFKDVDVCAITANNTELVVASHDPDGRHVPWWRVPVLGGSPIRIGDSQVESVVTTPDGQLMFREGSDIYLAKADGTAARKLLTAPPGVTDYKYFSPDMSRLRFSVFDVRNGISVSPALWEASHDGSHLHRFLPHWNRDGSECCGTWTPDGKYYVFQATVDGVTSLYWLREGGIFTTGSRQPVELMAMPMRNSVPMVSRDGKKVFFLGSQPRAELSVYDSALQEFVPYLGGIPAEGVSFSKDGKWVAYVRLPEGTLWRMKMDGSDQLQLTFPPMRVYAPRWSPDGRRMAFWDVSADGHSKIYIIPREGGSPEVQTSGESGAHDPTWSPDGNALMFDYDRANDPRSGVRILDLKTHAVAELPGSKGLFSPRWSPDGRYVTALTSWDFKLMLFDFSTQKWEVLAGSGAGFPNWSKDSKYVYFDDSQGLFWRAEIATHKVEEVARDGNAQAASGIMGYPWRGVALDGSPLIAREAGSEEVYALDVNFP